MDMVTNLTGPATMAMDFHPHAGAAVAKDPLRLMPNLDIMVILMDFMDIPMDSTDTVVLLPPSRPEAPKAWEERG